MTKLAKAGAIGFILWGLLHVVGGGAILAATLSDPSAGFATYRTATPPYDALAGAILGYFAFGLICLGLTAAYIGIRGNWRNSETALAQNTALILLTEIGLILFLLIPGHLSFVEASPGFVFAAIGIILGGIACRQTHEPAHGEA